ncbi:hypothetical protein QWY31_16165 [Cytophagales bacterium LB-30]|uniref:Uncharacterized protein n=1 Tax=Shiella aurantiaca TaxID=3058365 RepID=A0ABT8F999_9BACT|nr:hypothetical protein [Shiella aurantiaca]MDN4167047.1 hypothetical protein [Shiella aurantiaca]
MRKIQEGNELWKSYCRLNKPELEEFKKALVNNRINYSTFYKDSKLDKDSQKIPVVRERFYLECFPELEKVFSGEILPPDFSKRNAARKILREKLNKKLRLRK